jgi:hypothetical protein
VALLMALIPVRLALYAADDHVSGLVRMSSTEPLADSARRADPDFAFVEPGAHYDGVYFYAIATDPFARGRAHDRIDKAAYRYGHAGYGWLAGLLSVGHSNLVPTTLLALALLGIGASAGLASRLFRHFGQSGWWGLTVALNPGLIYATTVLTSEPVSLALLLGAILLWVRGETGKAAALFAVLCFFKEPLVMVPIVVAAFEVFRRAPRDEGLPRRLTLLAIGPVLFACWYGYLRATFGHWPFSQQDGFFEPPFVGWLRSIYQASRMARGQFLDAQLGAASVPLIAVTAALLLVGFVAAARWTSCVHAIFVPLALTVACLSPLGVLYPKDLMRETALAVALVPLAVAASSRAGHPTHPPLANA